MPRYIDADALIEDIKRVYCTDCNNYGGVRCRACGTDDAMLMIDDAPTADVVPRDEVEMHGQSYYFKLEQAIESSERFMAEHDAALAKKIFEEIESVLFTVANPCPSADGTIIVKHSNDFHLRREDYYTIKEKHTKGK